MTVIYREEDGDLGALSGRRIGIIGYGNLGRPAALNLRDSGLTPLVCDGRPERQEIALSEGFAVASMREVVQTCDLLMLLYRDEAMPQIYLEQMSPHLHRGQMLVFASAYNIAFGFIEAPPFVDVGLIAPRATGVNVRARYERGQGFTSFVSVAQDASGQSWPALLGLALALGALRGGAVELRFEQEAELDLFLQQAVMPVLHHTLMTAADLLMRLGYPPEAVFSELYLSGELADHLRDAARDGLMTTLKQSSLTAQYGTLSRYERFNELKLERLMEITLEEIRAGRFAKEWNREYTADYPRLKALLRGRDNLDLWEMEQQTIELRGQRDADDLPLTPASLE